MFRSLSTLVVIVFASCLLSGCIYSREIARTRRDIERQYPEAELDREIVLNLGPGSLRFARWVTGFIDDEEVQMAKDYLKEIGRIKLGVYNVERSPASLADFDASRLNRLKKQGWEVAVKAQDEESVVWVMYRERRRSIRDLYVFVLDDEDLVLARVQGRLGRLLERVVEDHGSLSGMMGRDNDGQAADH